MTRKFSDTDSVSVNLDLLALAQYSHIIRLSVYGGLYDGLPPWVELSKVLTSNIQYVTIGIACYHSSSDVYFKHLDVLDDARDRETYGSFKVMRLVMTYYRDFTLVGVMSPVDLKKTENSIRRKLPKLEERGCLQLESKIIR